jgi:phosphate acetyltransferase
MTIEMHPVLDRIYEKVRGTKNRIVLPEGNDRRVVQAAAAALEMDVCRPLLLGDPDEARKIASDAGVELGDIEVVTPKTSPQFSDYCDRFIELRSRRGKEMKRRVAERMMEDPLFFGAMMVREGAVDGAVAGAVNTTANVVRSALYIIGLRDGVNTISSLFLMLFENRELGCDGALLFADCGVVPDPTVEQLAEIGAATADMAPRLLDCSARVAMISFSTHGSASHEDVDKVKQATERLRSDRPDLLVDGEIQVDAALVSDVAQRKCPDSPLEGRANTLIFPDLNTGNTVYKATERFAGAEALGPVLLGLRHPMNDLSRGCRWEDIVGQMIITTRQNAPAE